MLTLLTCIDGSIVGDCIGLNLAGYNLKPPIVERRNSTFLHPCLWKLLNLGSEYSEGRLGSGVEFRSCAGFVLFVTGRRRFLLVTFSVDSLAHA